MNQDDEQRRVEFEKETLPVHVDLLVGRAPFGKKFTRSIFLIRSQCDQAVDPEGIFMSHWNQAGREFFRAAILPALRKPNG